MNHIDQIWRVVGIAGLLLIFSIGSQAQTTATCNLSIGGANYPIDVSVPSTALTGQDFILSLTLPGFSTSCAGNYDVSITTSNNLLKSSGGTVPFTGTFPTYTNASPLPNDIGRNILIPFRFKPGVTCKNEKGDFDITVKIPCNGQTYTCNLKVSITADAKNYWQGSVHYWMMLLSNTR